MGFLVVAVLMNWLDSIGLRINHCFQEVNQCADTLAWKKGWNAVGLYFAFIRLLGFVL